MLFQFQQRIAPRPALGDRDAHGRRGAGIRRQDGDRVGVAHVALEREGARLEVAALAGQGGAQREEASVVDDAARLEQVADLAGGRAVGDREADLAVARSLERLEELDEEGDRDGGGAERDEGEEPQQPPPAVARLRAAGGRSGRAVARAARRRGRLAGRRAGRQRRQVPAENPPGRLLGGAPRAQAEPRAGRIT